MGQVNEVNVATQSDEDLKSYAIYIARYRVTPEINDGLKPVIRRILWCLGNDYRGGEFIKTIAVMATTVKKYNPHGDASIQPAIRNMINDFSIKYPTVQGRGSWGSKAIPYPAAPRYNYCRISQFAVDVFLSDIYEDKRSTDWIDNYDNTCKEPAYFPAKIPALLVLGQMGIGVGMKPSIPSHNLGEVIDVTIKLMRDPNTPFCLIPDECMSCEIYDTDFQKINDTGIGTYVTRGIVDIGTYGNNPALYVRSLPDYTFFDTVKASILKLISSGKMPYIIDLISRSTVDMKTAKSRFEEVIVLKKGTDPNFVREFLYTNTSIRQTRQVDLIVIKNNKLEKDLNYRDYLLSFINFRRSCVSRKFNAKIQTYETKIHERELYLKAITSGAIDDIIKLIKKQDVTDENALINVLVKKINATPLQAKQLLNTDIKKLSKGYVKKYQEELKGFQQQLKIAIDILTNPKMLDDYIINEMLEIKRKYNTPRLCKVISNAQANGIAPGTFKLIVTNKNFIKKVGEHESAGLTSSDSVNFSIIVDNTEDVLLFSNIGKVFRIPVHKVPLSGKGSNGIDLRILNKYATSDICCAARETTLKNLATNKRVKNYIFMISEAGYIKKIDISDILTAPPSGIVFSKLDPGDQIKAMLFGPDVMDLLIISGQKVLRLSPKEVPLLKRSTKGNRASTSSSKIDGMNFVIPNTTNILIITENGYINRLPIDIIPLSNRGKAGTKVIKLGKDDKIVKVITCNPDMTISIPDGRGSNEMLVDQIPMGSSLTSGTYYKNGNRAVLLTK